MIRQMAFWPRIAVHGATQQAPVKRRKRSEKRQRTARVTIRLLPAERAALDAAAQHAHISIAALLRNIALEHISQNNTTKEQ